MNDREQIAHSHGFESFADLLESSHPLPWTRGETCKSYLARHPDGLWFVWRDGPIHEEPMMLR